MADHEDRAPMTIKGVPKATRLLMGKCASKRGETMAEWLARAVENQANLEARDGILPPGKPEQSAGLPVEAPAGLGELAALLQAAGAANVQPSRRMMGQVNALIADAARAARGLPPQRPSLPRKRPGLPAIEGEVGK